MEIKKDTDNSPMTIERELETTSSALSVLGSEIDIQISTAKRYPRSLRDFKELALEMATLDEETSAACFYVLPRSGKSVEGPSARLAEIIGSAWGNMRAEGKPIDEDMKFVTARGTAWDLQRNVAISYEVKRRITDRNGRRYPDDMVGMTANAATSIALRNAILKVVPSPFWKPIYQACRQVVRGDVTTLSARRDECLKYYQQLGVHNDKVLHLLGVKGIEDINLDHLLILRGLATALKEGDTTIDEAFAVEDVTKNGKSAFEQLKEKLTGEKKDIVQERQPLKEEQTVQEQKKIPDEELPMAALERRINEATTAEQVDILRIDINNYSKGRRMTTDEKAGYQSLVARFEDKRRELEV